MADDQTRHLHLLTGPANGETVETVTPDLAPPRVGQRIRVGERGQRRVKRGVEHGDVRHMRECRTRSCDRINRGTIVQRRQFDELSQASLARVVDHGWVAEVAPVDDSMRDGLDTCRHRLERFDLQALLVLCNDVQLQARRSRVDDEDGQPGQTQSRISGGSSPCSRPYARTRNRLSIMSCLR
jgi:hypothetical protein